MKTVVLYKVQIEQERVWSRPTSHDDLTVRKIRKSHLSLPCVSMYKKDGWIVMEKIGSRRPIKGTKKHKAKIQREEGFTLGTENYYSYINK